MLENFLIVYRSFYTYIQSAWVGLAMFLRRGGVKESSSTSTSAATTTASDKTTLSFRLTRTHSRCSVQHAGGGLLPTAPTSLARRTKKCHGRQGFACDRRLCQEGVLADPPKLATARYWRCLSFRFWGILGAGRVRAFPSRSVFANVPKLFSAVPIGLSALFLLAR